MAVVSVTVVGAPEVISAIRHLPSLIDSAFQSAANQTIGIMNRMVDEVFAEAANAAGEGFPLIYREHLLQTVSMTSAKVEFWSGSGFSVNYDFDQLGSYEDLSEGFHYHAMTADGDQVELPYTGQPLKNDLGTRYEYWLTMFFLDSEGLAETYAARVAWWSTKGVAPEWLLLNFGEPYFPAIMPFPLVETIRYRLGHIMQQVLDQELDRALRESKLYQTSTDQPIKVMRYGVFTKRPNYEWIRVGNRMAGSRRIR